MTWFKRAVHVLTAGECASDGCLGAALYRLEVGDVGSNYCGNCKLKIEARDAGTAQ